ncbi:MAG: hypothetical protein RO009_01700 [Pseudorhodoplanes sp.]|jgi:hypothetical protein|nr:hypothetical protein [Pseudorhodoplanes sp.]
MTQLPVYDTSPLAQPWISWRSLPADAFGPAEITAMTAALDGMCFAPDGGWRRAADGDAAVAIRLALKLLPISAITQQVDIVMTALARCAATGNPAACLVLAKILRQAPIDKALASRLSVSWLTRNLVQAPLANLRICNVQIAEPPVAPTRTLLLVPTRNDGRRA